MRPYSSTRHKNVCQHIPARIQHYDHMHSTKPTLLSLPEQVAQLLPWYMQWSCDLAAKMHCRHLVRNEACCISSPSLSCECSCDSEWWCEPHNACFIHNSCFCPSSGAFPPVKPLHM